MAKHIHQYRRAVLGKDYEIYRCTLPGCEHYISSQLIVGKKNICWRCGEPHVITRKLAKPHCYKCTNHKQETMDRIQVKNPKDKSPTSPLDVLLGRVLDDG